MLRPLFIFVLFSPFSLYAKVTHSIAPETQLQSWKVEDNGVEIEFIQRLPDQSRAFFQGRGFSANVADDIGNSCILQVIARNNKDKKSAVPITIRLKDWRVKSGRSLKGIKLKETWDHEWSDEKVNKTARIAFRWATFPTEQTFDAGGDYNWGMISVGLKPGEQFDMLINWHENNQSKEQWLKNVICAADR